MKAFLGALSALPGLEATTLDWRRMLGPDTFAWAAPFLRHTGRIATAVHCPFGCGCAHEIAPGDDPPRPFSHWTERLELEQTAGEYLRALS